MHTEEILTGYLLDDASLTLEELCAACAVEPVWVIHHVEEGLLMPVNVEAQPSTVTAWRFTSASLTRIRRIHTLERDFDAVPELAALMVDLLEEVDTLRAQIGLKRYR